MAINMKWVAQRGEAAAKKICVRGCLAGYESCDRPQRNKEAAVRLIREDNGCPLAKYNVPDVPEKPFPENLVDRLKGEDTFWACANCKDGGLIEEGEQWVITTPNWETACVDCPVQMHRESIEELEAEARCS